MALNPLHAHLGRGNWPPQSVANRWYQASVHHELVENDYASIYQQAQVDGLAPRNMRERHVMLPVAQMITQVSATLVCGGPISIKAADSNDQQRMDEIIRGNKLSSKTVSAAQEMSAIGGVYARVFINDTTPLGRRIPRIELVSEQKAIPSFSGDELVAATFITEHRTEKHVMRLHESYELGGITYSVTLGTQTEQGANVPVGDWAQVDSAWPYAEERSLALRVDLVPDTLLAVYIPNGSTSTGALGKSDLDGIEQLLMSINAAFTTSLDSYQASAPVLAVDEALLDGQGQLPAGVKVMPSRLSMPGEGGAPMEIFQGSFASKDHVDYLDHLLDTCLTMSGISPASLGRGLSGSVSGTALRLRMYQSLAQAATKREALAEGLSELLRAAALLDTQAYGMKPAAQWADAAGLPTVELTDGLPVDQLEQAQIASTLLTAGIASQKSAIKIAQPGLSEEQAQAELESIQAGQASAISGAVSSAVAGVQPLTLDQLTPPAN